MHPRESNPVEPMLSGPPAAAAVMSLLNRRIGHVLDAAELSLSPDAFKVFRRIVLKQFGTDELGADIERLIARSAAGTDRNGQGRS